MPSTITVIVGDITRIGGDAIINAANETLLGGAGGVDAAIHRAAGPGLRQECESLGGCPVGQAKVTKGSQLATRSLIHAVGPRWRGGAHGEPELLASAYRAALRLARERRCRSIVLPAISTGNFGYPVTAACRVAVDTVREVTADGQPESIIFCAFDQATGDVLTAALA